MRCYSVNVNLLIWSGRRGSAFNDERRLAVSEFTDVSHEDGLAWIRINCAEVRARADEILQLPPTALKVLMQSFNKKRAPDFAAYRGN
jgi:hypothetical protein